MKTIKLTIKITYHKNYLPIKEEMISRKSQEASITKQREKET